MTHHLTDVEHIDQQMQDCIDACSDCHDVCVATIAHCLTRGGEHASLDHIRALADCAQACDASRDFMLRGSQLHHRICAACSEACKLCAESCAQIGGDDEVMLRCAEICMRCAESCDRMAGTAS